VPNLCGQVGRVCDDKREPGMTFGRSPLTFD
jgi:hypothetical protein